MALKQFPFVKMTALLLSFLVPNSAIAACYTNGASGRLENYCALDKIQNAKVDLRTIQLIDYRLKREGMRRGLGLQTQIATNTINKFAYPIISYSDNINGGNSSETLVLGDLAFMGEKELYRKDGIVAGLGIGFNGRYIHSEGRYLNYGLGASYAHSPEYGIGIATSNLKISSVNHIRNWWYLDVHANSSRVRKKITDDTSSNISLVSSKVYKSGQSAYSEVSFGLNRYFAESYTQNQLMFRYDTIHSNGVNSSVDLNFGENVSNTLATKMAMNAKIITQIVKKPLIFSIGYASADGGVLLGYERSNQTYSISASYPVWNNLTVSIGYKETDSTIDYFDTRAPVIGLQFSSISF